MSERHQKLKKKLTEKIVYDLERHNPSENIFHAFQQIQHPGHTVLNIFDIVSHVPQYGYGTAPFLAVLGGEQVL